LRYNPSHSEDGRQENLEYEASREKLARPCLKNYIKRAGVIAQVVDHLPSMHEATSSIPSTAKLKKKKAEI
jgi:hypothetical protein